MLFFRFRRCECHEAGICFCFGSLLVGGGKSSFLFLVFCFEHLKLHAGVRVFCLVLLPRVTREVTQNIKSSCHGLMLLNV